MNTLKIHFYNNKFIPLLGLYVSSTRSLPRKGLDTSSVALDWSVGSLARTCRAAKPLVGFAKPEGRTCSLRWLVAPSVWRSQAPNQRTYVQPSQKKGFGIDSVNAKRYAPGPLVWQSQLAARKSNQGLLRDCSARTCERANKCLAKPNPHIGLALWFGSAWLCQTRTCKRLLVRYANSKVALREPNPLAVFGYANNSLHIRASKKATLNKFALQIYKGCFACTYVQPPIADRTTNAKLARPCLALVGRTESKLSEYRGFLKGKIVGSGQYQREAKNLLKNKNHYKNYYTSYCKLSEIKLLTIGIASPLRILQWAEKTLPNGKIYGEVLNANTLHHKTFKPQKGGLFCERIFGPLKDFECACGKIQKPNKQNQNLTTLLPVVAHTCTPGQNPDERATGAELEETKLTDTNPTAIQSDLTTNILEGFDSQKDNKTSLIFSNSINSSNKSYQETRKFCPDCDVEYTWSVIRRYQLGYIKLCSPVTHIWFLKGTPSYLSLLLNIKKRHLQLITYCSEFLTIEKSAFITSCFLLIPNKGSKVILSLADKNTQKDFKERKTNSEKQLKEIKQHRVFNLQLKYLFKNTKQIETSLLSKSIVKTHGYQKQHLLPLHLINELGLKRAQAAFATLSKINLLFSLLPFSGFGIDSVNAKYGVPGGGLAKPTTFGLALTPSTPSTYVQAAWLCQSTNANHQYELNTSYLPYKFLWVFNLSNNKNMSADFLSLTNTIYIKNFSLLYSQFNQSYIYANFILKSSNPEFGLHVRAAPEAKHVRASQTNARHGVQPRVTRKIPTDLYIINLLQQNLCKQSLNQLIETSWNYLLKKSAIQSSNKAKLILLPIFIDTFANNNNSIYNKKSFQKMEKSKNTFLNKGFGFAKHGVPGIGSANANHFVPGYTYGLGQAPGLGNREGCTYVQAAQRTPNAWRSQTEGNCCFLNKKNKTTAKFYTSQNAKFLSIFLNNLKSKYQQVGHQLFKQIKCSLQLNKWSLNVLTRFYKKNKIFKVTQITKIEKLFNNSNYINQSNKLLISQIPANKILNESTLFIQYNEIEKAISLNMQSYLFNNSITNKIRKLLTKYLLNSFLLDFYSLFYANMDRLNVALALPSTYVQRFPSVWQRCTYVQALGSSLRESEGATKPLRGLASPNQALTESMPGTPYSPEGAWRSQTNNQTRGGKSAPVIFTKSLVVLSLFSLFQSNKIYKNLKTKNKQEIKQNVFYFYKQFFILQNQLLFFGLLSKILLFSVIKCTQNNKFFNSTTRNIFSSLENTLSLRAYPNLAHTYGQSQTLPGPLVWQRLALTESMLGRAKPKGNTYVQALGSSLRLHVRAAEGATKPLPRWRSQCAGLALPNQYARLGLVSQHRLGFGKPKGFAFPTRELSTKEMTKLTKNSVFAFSKLQKSNRVTYVKNKNILNVINKKRLYNNVYTLSHRERWQNEKDWQVFTLFTFTNMEDFDYNMINYTNRLVSFNTERTEDLGATPSVLNINVFTNATNMYQSLKANQGIVNKSATVNKHLMDSNPLNWMNDKGKKRPASLLESTCWLPFGLAEPSIDPVNAKQENYQTNKSREQFEVATQSDSFYKFSKISSFYSGAGIVQQLINELNFYEIAKLDKQNRLVLYALNKVILKLKKQVQIFVYNKTTQLELKELCKKRDLLIRRTKLVRKLFRKNSNVNSMILTLIPVLPPDLRPIVKMGNQIAASDLNRLYQRVIYRNDRLKKFLKDPATSQSYEMKYAQRLLQESVDNLLQNGKSGVNSEKDARGRMLKSLSDILKGKQGRFRQFLLGKRVDYSGRSVIVVGPKLKLHECGLPLEMAKELYLPFLLKSILNKNYARTVIGAKTLIKNNASLTHELLREIMQVSPVLLNRAPTLHRLGIQAFSPKLVEGRAILLHPLVCSAFNADFDGDQMAVHIPITTEARAEAWKMMCAHNNILSTATGDPLAIPSQDMVLGCYYLTTQPNKLNGVNNKQQLQETKSKEEPNVQIGNSLNTSNSLYYNSFDDVIKIYEQQLINVHTLVWVKCSLIIENGSDQEEPIEIQVNSFGQWREITSNYYRMYNLHNNLINQFVLTTPGRILFNLILQKIASA